MVEYSPNYLKSVVKSFSATRYLWTGEPKDAYVRTMSTRESGDPDINMADNSNNNRDFIARAKKVQGLGFAPIPIVVGEEKKPPSWFAWTDLRDGKRRALTDKEIEDIFSNPEVGRVALLLNKKCLLIDYDGAVGQYMLWSELIPRCSKELQRALRSTARTKTPHGGHILVLLDASTFPDGIEEMLCWQLLANGGQR